MSTQDRSDDVPLSSERLSSQHDPSSFLLAPSLVGPGVGALDGLASSLYEDDGTGGDTIVSDHHHGGNAGIELLLRGMASAAPAADAATETPIKSLRPSPALLRQLIQCAETERYSPDLLPYPQQLVDSIVGYLAAKQDEANQLARMERAEAAAKHRAAEEALANGALASDDVGTSGVLPFSPSDLMGLEMQRVSFFLCELLRCRVKKIEKLSVTIAYAHFVLRELELERERGENLGGEVEDDVSNAFFDALFDDSPLSLSALPAVAPGPRSDAPSPFVDDGTDALHSLTTSSRAAARKRVERKVLEAFGPREVRDSLRLSRGSMALSTNAPSSLSRSDGGDWNSIRGGSTHAALHGGSADSVRLPSYAKLLKADTLTYFQRLVAVVSPNELLVAQKLAHLKQQALLDGGLRHFPFVLQSLTPFSYSSVVLSGGPKSREPPVSTLPAFLQSARILSSCRATPAGTAQSIWNQLAATCSCFTLLAEGEEMLRRSDPSSSYVFAMILEDLGEMNLGEGAVQSLKAGEMLLVPLSVVQQYVDAGKVRLM